MMTRTALAASRFGQAFDDGAITPCRHAYDTLKQGLELFLARRARLGETADDTARFYARHAIVPGARRRHNDYHGAASFMRPITRPLPRLRCAGGLSASANRRGRRAGCARLKRRDVDAKSPRRYAASR